MYDDSSPLALCPPEANGKVGAAASSGQSPGGISSDKGLPLENHKDKTPAKPARRVLGRMVPAADIVLDPGFAGFLPQPSAEELRRLRDRLFRYGCREPLVVWPHRGRLVLVTGYPQFPIIKRWRIPFRVIDRAFANRDEVRTFLTREALSLPTLPKLWGYYLLGLRYVEDPPQHGGDRRSSDFVAGRTAHALAEMLDLGISPRTLRLNGEFAGAVNRILANCSAKGPNMAPATGKNQCGALSARRVKDLLLGSRIGRDGIFDLDRLGPERQRELVSGWLHEGNIPRSWRSEVGESPSPDCDGDDDGQEDSKVLHFSVPRDQPEAQAKGLDDELGTGGFDRLLEAMARRRGKQLVDMLPSVELAIAVSAQEKASA